MASQDVSRREFLGDASKMALGAVVAPMIVPRHVLGGPGYQAPSDTINFAVVGFGGMGSNNAFELSKTETLAAICDVDLAFSEHQVQDKGTDRDGKVGPEGQRFRAQCAKAKRYADFREMLQKEPGIDGIVIATPDHVHAVAAKAAMDLGKHVYVQKPLCYSVHEAECCARPRSATRNSSPRWETRDTRARERGASTSGSRAA